MTFKAQLFALIVRADAVHMDGYDTEDLLVYVPSHGRLGGPSRYEVDLTGHLGGDRVYVFLDQEVEVDDCGMCDALDTDGTVCSFDFSMHVSITEEDLA